MRYIISAIMLTLTVAVWAQLPESSATEKPGRSEWRSRYSRSTMGRRMSIFRDTNTTGAASGQFRQAFMDEIRHVPGLESKLTRLMAIQQEKQTIRQKLELTARQTDRPSAVLWKEFHDLLARQDELTTRQGEIVSELVRDAEVIQDELVARRNEVSASLDELRRNDSDDPEQRSELRTQGRILRMYDMLIDRVATLKDSPSQGEWLLGFMRGMHMPVEGVDPRLLEQARWHLQQLEQDCDELRRRMATVESQIVELREMLDIASSPATRKGGRNTVERPGRPAGQNPHRHPGPDQVKRDPKRGTVRSDSGGKAQREQ